MRNLVISGRKLKAFHRGKVAKNELGRLLFLVCLTFGNALWGFSLNGKTHSKVIKNRTLNFAQLGRWERVIVLDPPADGWFSHIDHAELDPQSGDLVVLERRHPGQVCRYDGTGKLLHCYGNPNGQGPGEYLGLRDFALLANGSVVVIGARKTMLFAADGSLIKEKLNGAVSPSQAVARGNGYFLTHTGIIKTGKTGNRWGIFPVTGGLQVAQGFHPFDERLNLHMLAPNRHFTLYKGRLYLGDWFDFRIYSYDTEGKRIALYDYGTSELDFSGLKEGVWDEKRASQISRNISRAIAVQGFNGGVFVNHINRSVGRLSTPGILKPEEGILYLFPALGFIYRMDTPAFAKMDQVVGSYGGGVICSIVDEERLARARPLLPALEAFPEGDDRAYLFFLRLNPEPGKRVN